MFKKNMVKFIEKYQNDKDIELHLGGYENKPTIETKYLMALGTLENIYIVHTNGSKAHKILRNDIQNYVEYLEKQLQQKEDIINKAKEYIKDNANIYTNIMGKEVGFFKSHNDGWTPIELLEILNIDKGE